MYLCLSLRSPQYWPSQSCCSFRCASFGRRLSFIDFPLVVVVYIALQRDAWQALVVGTLAGIIVDACKRWIDRRRRLFQRRSRAYIIYFAATQSKPRKPAVTDPCPGCSNRSWTVAIYVFWHRVAGLRHKSLPVMQTISYKLIATTQPLGTVVLYMLDSVVAESSAQRRQFATRRRVARQIDWVPATPMKMNPD